MSICMFVPLTVCLAINLDQSFQLNLYCQKSHLIHFPCWPIQSHPNSPKENCLTTQQIQMISYLKDRVQKCIYRTQRKNK